MREIKFRGKRTDTGTWVYGDLQHVQKICTTEEAEKSGKRSMQVVRIANYDVDEETVGQFIGTTDKNENEIYEGDIIKTDDGLDISGYYVVSYDIGTTGFVCVGKDVHCHPGIIEEFSDIVVVGNIYDNKELLTQEYERID